MSKNDKYQKEIHRLWDSKLVRHNAWRDVKQDEFINKFITDLITESHTYAVALDEYSDYLEETRINIAKLVGEDASLSPMFVGYQNERGDISGGSRSIPYVLVKDVRNL